MDFPLPIITRNFISKEFRRVCRRNFLKNGKQLIDFLHYLRFIYIFMKNSNGKRRFFQYPMIGVIFDAVGKRKCSQFPITNSQNLYLHISKSDGKQAIERNSHYKISKTNSKVIPESKSKTNSKAIPESKFKTNSKAIPESKPKTNSKINTHNLPRP